MTDFNQQNIENGNEMCNHNYNDINNTLVGMPKLKMVSPTKYYLQCQKCGEVFTIQRDDIDNIKEFLHQFF